MVGLEEKLRAIESCDDLGDLQARYWPESFSENYLFISYSHADYKLVFRDILQLQAAGINIWYDRSLAPGYDWELEAEQYISNYNCIGVIFYLTPNSLRSPAIRTEIEYVRKRKKPYFSINQPIEVDGVRRTVSAKEMFHLLGYDRRDREMAKLLDEVFDEKVIFLSTEDATENKVEKIGERLKKAPLFCYQVGREHVGSTIRKLTVNDLDAFRFHATAEGYASLVSVNNLDLIRPPELPAVVTLDGTDYVLAKIENCAFANCRKMECITLPPTLRIIKPNAFYNCVSLTSLTLPEGVTTVGSSAFSGCEGLETCVLPSTLTELRSWAFAGCRSLRRLFVPASVHLIGENAFVNCPNLTICCEASAPPAGWHADWNRENRPVLWGVAP